MGWRPQQRDDRPRDVTELRGALLRRVGQVEMWCSLAGGEVAGGDQVVDVMRMFPDDAAAEAWIASYG